MIKRILLVFVFLSLASQSMLVGAAHKSASHLPKKQDQKNTAKIILAGCSIILIAIGLPVGIVLGLRYFGKNSDKKARKKQIVAPSKPNQTSPKPGSMKEGNKKQEEKNILEKHTNRLAKIGAIKDTYPELAEKMLEEAHAAAATITDPVMKNNLQNEVAKCEDTLPKNFQPLQDPQENSKKIALQKAALNNPSNKSSTGMLVKTLNGG